MKDKILILGAAGFIGTNLSLRLLQNDNQLILFDRTGSLYIPQIQKAKDEKKLVCIEGSFTDISKQENGWMNSIPNLSKVKTVYHLISTTCPTNSNKNTAIEMEENVLSTIHFLDACVDAGVEKVIFLSSGGTVYGSEHTGFCSEEQEAFPITVYGAQKLTIEKLLYLYYKMYHLDYRIVRLSNPYGPYQKTNGVQGVVSTFTWNAMQNFPIKVYGDGSVVRDYIYIDDAIEGILRIADWEGKYRLYNLGSGQGHTVTQVIDIIKQIFNKEIDIQYLPSRPVDVPVNILNISRFEKDFGSLNKTDLKEGIQKLIDFWKQNS